MARKIFMCVSGCTDSEPCFLIVPDDEGVRPRYCPFNRAEEDWWEVEYTTIVKDAVELMKSIIKEKIEALQYKVAFLAELQNQVGTIVEEVDDDGQA